MRLVVHGVDDEVFTEQARQHIADDGALADIAPDDDEVQGIPSAVHVVLFQLEQPVAAFGEFVTRVHIQRLDIQPLEFEF